MRHGPNKHPRSDLTDSYFNWNLRDARVEAGYTLGQLAQRAGVSSAVICFYERLREFPSPAAAEKIANALGVKADYLFPEEFREIIREVRMEREDSLREGSQLCSLDGTDKGDLAIRKSPERESVKDELSASVETALYDLNFREREVLKLRYGIGGGYCFRQEEIGRMFRVTRERVRQIEGKAMKKLRDFRIIERLRLFWEAG